MPTDKQLAAVARPMYDALLATKRLIDEALPCFDWGKSALDANAIQLLNDVPLKVNEALRRAQER